MPASTVLCGISFVLSFVLYFSLTLKRQTNIAADDILFFHFYRSKKSNEKILMNIVCCSRDWRFTPVLRIDNQQNFKIMKISILFKSFISLFYIIRYIL